MGALRRAAPLLVLAALAAGCERDADEAVRLDPPPAALGVHDEGQPTPGFDVLQAGQLTPQHAGTAQLTGRVTVLAPSADAGMPEGLQLEVRMHGLGPGMQYGWHMHMGSCTDEAQVIIGLAPGAEAAAAASVTEPVARPLVADEQGQAFQTAVRPDAGARDE